MPIIIEQTPQELVLTPALFIDLDGTVRRSKSGETFISDYQDIELMPSIESILSVFREKGYHIVAISNQGGVAFGFKTVEQIDQELDATIALFKENPFHQLRVCYHMEKGSVWPYNHRSLFRKPNIGMLCDAEATAWEHGYILDYDHSLFVGDRPEDEQCAKNADIPFLHIDDFLKQYAPVVAKEPDLPTTLDEAVDYLLPRFVGMEKYYKPKNEEDFAAFCHSQLSGGIGMKIRNELKLWIHESPLHQYFLTHHNLFHADDMSGLILRHIYRKLKPF